MSLELSSTTLEPPKRRGRPPGSGRKGKARPALSPALRDELAACIEQLQGILRTRISVQDSQSRVESIYQEQRNIVANVVARLTALA